MFINDNNMNNEKVLITGGFGAIGTNLISTLLINNCEIKVIDNLSSGIINYNNNIDYTFLDITNYEKVNSYFENYKPDYIFHLAAHFANQNSVDHPISDTNTNVLGLINLLEIQKNNKNLKKFIYASSSCVYGNSINMIEDQDISPFETPYAINKYIGELYTKYYSNIHSIPIVSVRIFNTFGPGEMPGKYRNVIPNFIEKALNCEDIIITGSGEETRDFTYVADTVDLFIKAASSEFKTAEIFNGGTGETKSIKNLAETIIKLTSSSSNIQFQPKRNWDHVVNRCSNIEKSQKLLNYLPVSNFEDGLLKTINWIREKMGK
jgi:UDP-glucose 4-epimerase